MSRFDFHIHTTASPAGHVTPQELPQAAIAAGLTHIAITDHYEAQPADPALFPGGNSKPWLEAAADRYEQVSAKSWANAETVRELTAGKVAVAFGLELGSPLDDRARTEELIARRPYDFLLASQHANPGKPDWYYLQSFPDFDIAGELDAYFDALLAIVQWGRFHSLAHLTYPFRYIPGERLAVLSDVWEDKADAVLRGLAEKGLALEINTGGLRKSIGETSPTLPLVKRFKQLGGEFITIGSDAHRPNEVGAGLAVAEAIAADAGFRYITRYEQGKPIPERIK